MNGEMEFDQYFRQAMSLRDGQTSSTPKLDPGEWPYEDDHLIEQGGMKRVIRCRDRRSGRLVARAELLRPEKDTEKFLREARLTAQLQHPHIMPIYEIGRSPEIGPYFIMKLAEGEDLESILEKLRADDVVTRRSFPLPVRLSLFSRICEAMAYAHQRGVIHLDLKPANIEVSAHGEILVCDWGLARVLDEVCEDPSLLDHSLDSQELNSLTRDGYIKGSPGYMSPEQAGGAFTRKDQRSDIFALGAILYSLLCYEKPFQGDSLEACLEATRRGDFLPLGHYRPRRDIPESLEAICRQAMSVAPENRYSSVDALLDDLNAYLNGFAPQAETASFSKQVWLLVKRNRMSSAVLTFSTLCLLVMVAVFIHNIEAARRLAESSEETLRRELAVRPQFYQFQALEADRRNDFDTSFALAQLALSLDPNLKEVWRVLGHGYFIREDFVASAKAYQTYGSNESDFVKIRPLVEAAAALQKNGHVLSETELLEILDKARSDNRWIIPRLAARHVRKNLSEEDRLVFVRGYLKLRNPDYPVAEFQFRNNILDLGDCQNLKDATALNFFPAGILVARSFHVSASYLKGMPLEELRLSNSKIPDFRGWLKFPSLRRIELRNCSIATLSSINELPHLEELDLRQSKFKDLNPICNCPSLKKLTLSPGFDPKQLSRLNKEIELIIGD